MNDNSAMAMAFLGGILSLLFAILFAVQVSNIPVDPSKVVTIRLADEIQKGAKAFLQSEYKWLSLFCVIVAILLAVIGLWQSAVCFLIGAALSAASGYMGMMIATISNIRTCLACQGQYGLNDGLRVAFKSGSVMALLVVGTGLTGLPVCYMIFKNSMGTNVWSALSGFAFGGSSIALFARVGGGIYTKAADVGADLVGKVEEELEEDSADNPATIADNVGDNVGDVAGMGADLFESYVGSLVAAATIGSKEFPGSFRGVAFPFYVAGLGAIASILGTFLVRAKQPRPDAKSGEILEELLFSIRRAIGITSVLVIGTTAIAAGLTFNDSDGWSFFFCVLIGLFCGNAIGYATEYATSYTYYPTQSIAQKSDTGPATVLIQGLGVGMFSTVPPVLLVAGTMLASYYVSNGNGHGFYGVAITAVGMLSTLGVTLATDAYGPVADNAGGIAEMAPDSEIASEVRETTDALDALGNTTAATGKGLAIGSAVLTALALLQAFADASGSTVAGQVGVNLLNPVVLPAVLIGALLPFVFAAQTMLSVGKAAESIMWECRDQLNAKHFEGTPLQPEKCVRITAAAAIKEMVAPGVLAVCSPIIVGTALGSKGLLGMLTGAISAGFLLAVMMANAGGAWDNAKKYVEKGNLGANKGKRSANHKAVVVGDTVGDPFKDTSGPALNILIKLMSIVSLVLADKLQPEPWDRSQWWISVLIIIVIAVGGSIFYWWLQKAWSAIHDRPQIEERSSKRKAANAARAASAEH